MLPTVLILKILFVPPPTVLLQVGVVPTIERTVPAAPGGTAAALLEALPTKILSFVKPSIGFGILIVP